MCSRSFISLGFLALIMSSTAMANAASPIIYGAGNLTCSSWSEGRGQAHNPVVPLARTWVLGFLSAMDGATHFISHDAKRLRNVDVDTVNGWLDDYCRANPADTIALAAARLTNELGELNR
jgi:hypothetical protein